MHSIDYISLFLSIFSGIAASIMLILFFKKKNNSK